MTLDKQRGGTFFIPSNTAIQALGCNRSISDTEMKNHVIQGYSAYLPRLGECQTLKNANGWDLKMTKSPDGGLLINDAKILSTNIILENGVAYVIDKVGRPFDSFLP